MRSNLKKILKFEKKQIMDNPTKRLLQQARDDATKAIIKSQKQKQEHPVLQTNQQGKQLKINYSQLKLNLQ